MAADKEGDAASDRSLVMQAREGNEDAAAELYERYAARVFGLVLKQMADPLRAQVEPEDIVQSVFKSIFRGMNAGVYEAPAGGSLWHLIAVIAVHKVRKNASRRLAEKRDARKTQSLDDFDGDLDADQLSPEAMECAIREAVEGLKESEQEIVMLRVQGYSVEEIAQRVNKSRRTTERLLQSARETLGAMLDLNQD